MTVDAKDLPTNNLNINEIEQNTSPNSLELGRGEERKPSQFVLGKDARLLYQSMLEKIVDAAIRLGIPLSLVAETSGYTQAPVPVTNKPTAFCPGLAV